MPASESEPAPGDNFRAAGYLPFALPSTAESRAQLIADWERMHRGLCGLALPPRIVTADPQHNNYAAARAAHPRHRHEKR